MNILLTGQSGFLGSYIRGMLLDNAHRVLGLSRGGDSEIRCDLATEVPDLKAYKSLDMVFHAAGWAHRVPKTEADKQLFFKVNVGGTQRLLEGLAIAGKIPKYFVFISTVAVYGDPFDMNIAVPPYPSREEAENLNLTPYAWSKWEAEQLVKEWCIKYGCECHIWRLPLIVGENAPGNLGAMEKAIRKGYYFRIGNSYKRMRYYVNLNELGIRVLQILGGNYFNSDTLNVISGMKSYGDFEDEIASKYGKKVRTIPLWIVRVAAKIGDFIPGFPLDSYRLNKILGT